MRKAQFTLTGKDVQNHTAALLRTHVGLKETEGKCTLSILTHLVCAAAARLTSIFAACAQMKGAPSSETARTALLATLPEYAKLQKGVNRALVADVPKALRQRKQHIAIDLHLVPYYGKPFQDPEEIYRSQAKAGTHSFHAYASAYVVYHGQRYTVALTPVAYCEDMKDIVQRLLALMRKAGIRPSLLLLDRGFYSIGVIRYLQRARVPFLMPAIAKGRKPAAGEPAKGIRAFRSWKRSGWGRHTLTAGKHKATVSICVHCGNRRNSRKSRGKGTKRGRTAWVYAYWGITPGSTRWIKETYRSPLRHRDELSAVERSPHQNLHTQSARAVFLHRRRVDPAKHLGLVALGATLHSATRPTSAPLGAPPLQGNAALAPSCSRIHPRRLRRNIYRTTYE